VINFVFVSLLCAYNQKLSNITNTQKHQGRMQKI